ncbi:MAG: hypothetical protein KIT35_13300 [Piscinibacter sp.]|uniref:hypothetical protein n=1 Tax=Piscinibacter sp. TaxID=1903157 RepID=UPI002587AAAC|nr:hypothetical protein [Piscinibacter sp.]MCW5664806.1 hypothetical protein [Piscinibacter sp.]
MAFDDVVTTGIVALFGGALLWAAVGALVGRFQGFQVGVAAAMMLFGLTGLGMAGWLAWLLWGGGGVGPGRDQIGLVGFFGAFGGFGLLGGGVILASELESRRPREPQPVAPWRARLATACTVSGNLAILIAFVLGLVLDDDMIRGTHTTFRGVTLACACWWLATVFGGRLRVSQTLFFALLGGGFYLASESLRLFGGA